MNDYETVPNLDTVRAERVDTVRPKRVDALTTLAIIGGGTAAVLHGESARAVGGVQLIGLGGRSSGGACAVAEALGCAELTVDDMISRADMLVVAVPPTETGEVLARIPLDRPLIAESPVGMGPAGDMAVRPNAMLGANLLHAQIARQGLAAIAALDNPHHVVLRANGVRPSWYATEAAAGGVTLDLGGRLLPVLLAAAGRPVVEVSARLDFEGPVDTGAELDLRLDDGRLIRAELSWDRGPTTANLEVAGANAVVSLELWPFPVLEIDGTEIASAESQDRLQALGFVPQLRRLAAVAENQADAWPQLSSGFGALRIVEGARLSARSGQVAHLV